MGLPEFKILMLGERGILIQFAPDSISDFFLTLLSIKNKLENVYKVEVVQTYNELLLKRLPVSSNFTKIKEELITIITGSSIKPQLRSSNFFEIPVCYDATLAPDLLEFSNAKSLSLEEIICLHTSPLYTINFLGFLPGFPYLSGLDRTLYHPRKEKPSLNLQKGSIAIGGNQTGIYPQDSPGGWHVIGKTPLRFFDATLEIPSALKAGDTLKFKSISLEKFKELASKVESGILSLKPVSNV